MMSNVEESLESSSTPTSQRHEQVAMNMFSLVTIRMLAYTSSGEPFPVTLSRSESFPARWYTHGIDYMPPYPKNWAAAPPPKDKAHLELILGNRIGEGRIGLVYEAHVSRISDQATGKEISPMQFGLPSDLCVKIAKSEHCRSLAREAWFYEQLPEKDGYQGVVAPRCFGLFTVSVNDCADESGGPPSSIRPWTERDPNDKPLKDNGRFIVPDWLNDDNDDGYFADDAGASKKNSPWNTWREDPDSRLLSLLVMERLGDCFPLGWARPHDDDLLDVFQDFIPSSVYHRDIRFTNVLQAVPETTVICPRHNRKHNWRLIDFDRACMTDNEYYVLDKGRVKALYDRALRAPYFRGISLN